MDEENQAAASPSSSSSPFISPSSPCDDLGPPIEISFNDGDQSPRTSSPRFSNVLIFFSLSSRTDKAMLERRCAQFGNLRTFKYVNIFKKAVVVFADEDECRACYQEMKHTYDIKFGNPVTESDLKLNELLPPPNERTFLVSPPSSPPPEWKGGREHPPENVLPPDFNVQELNDRLYMLYEGEARKGFPKIIVQRPIIVNIPAAAVETSPLPEL